MAKAKKTEDQKPQEQPQEPVVSQVPETQPPVEQPKEEQPPVEQKQSKDGLPVFEYEGKAYKVKLHAVVIPGIGTLTAADIATDEDAQKYLVDNNAIGSVIDLVV